MQTTKKLRECLFDFEPNSDMDGRISLLDFGAGPQDAHALISDLIEFHKIEDAKRVGEKNRVAENLRISEICGF